jgi:peptide deformylase
MGAVDGAIFGLLGLLIALGFSGAVGRFDARRHLIVVGRARDNTQLPSTCSTCTFLPLPMALRRILTYPDSELKGIARPVHNIDGGIDQLVTDMVETMYAAPGVGLAAIQVGVPQRVIVIDVDHENPGKNLVKLVNPVIVEHEGSVVWEEGCLSVVDYTAEVTRAERVLVKAWTLDQKEIEIEADDLLAVALQHEIDHLEGKLFIDRISRLKRDLYRRKVKKWLRDGVPLEAKKPAVSI